MPVLADIRFSGQKGNPDGGVGSLFKRDAPVEDDSTRAKSGKTRGPPALQVHVLVPGQLDPVCSPFGPATDWIQAERVPRSLTNFYFMKWR